MMGHREPLINADEQDFLTTARRFFVKRAGKFTPIKRAFNKRVRKAACMEIKQHAQTLSPAP